jgi:hypothetical protein
VGWNKPHDRARLLVSLVAGSSGSAAGQEIDRPYHPRWTRHFTPKHASWLNQIEDAFSVLDHRVIVRGSFTSKDDLRDKLYGYMIWHNQNARPFTWTYRPKSWSDNGGDTSDRRH